MIDPSTVRVRRARRAGAAVLLATGLTVGAVGIAIPTGQVAAAPVSAAEVVGLTKGARGEQVRALQTALNRVGIGVKYGVDGYFGSATLASVRAFQRYKGLPVTGVVDAATAKALGFSAPAATPAKPAAAPAKPAATPAAPAAGTATAIVGLQAGASGPAVVQLQQAITRIGWPIVADGTFGPRTQAALTAVQRANGLAATGVVDDRTAQLLRLTGPGAAPTVGAAPAAAAATTPTASTAAGFPVYDEHGARVVALQHALVAAGIALRGGADGVFGSGTLNGVLALQKSRGLPATGKVDASTAAALGLAPADPPAASAPVAISLEAKPLQGPCYYGDTWLAARSVGRVHLGVDILAKEGNELYAVTSGTISKIYTVEKDPLTGNGLRIARPDGTYFFYGHLSAFPPGIAVGTAVTAGQVVGYVGRTGNAGVPHLHLEVHPGGGSAVNPYPIVKATGAC